MRNTLVLLALLLALAHGLVFTNSTDFGGGVVAFRGTAPGLASFAVARMFASTATGNATIAFPGYTKTFGTTGLTTWGVVCPLALHGRTDVAYNVSFAATGLMSTEFYAAGDAIELTGRSASFEACRASLPFALYANATGGPFTVALSTTAFSPTLKLYASPDPADCFGAPPNATLTSSTSLTVNVPPGPVVVTFQALSYQGGASAVAIALCDGASCAAGPLTTRTNAVCDGVRANTTVVTGGTSPAARHTTVLDVIL